MSRAEDPALKPVFLYGLFMDESLLRQQGLHPTESKLACLPGFGLRIGEKATLEPAEQERAYGALMQLSGQELDLLYSGVGVSEYRPVDVCVHGLEGSQFDAVSYILPMSQVSGSNSDYAARLAELAAGIGLPAAYVEEIRTWV